MQLQKGAIVKLDTIWHNEAMANVIPVNERVSLGVIIENLAQLMVTIRIIWPQSLQGIVIERPVHSLTSLLQIKFPGTPVPGNIAEIIEQATITL